jgi:transcriptional regulator
MYIPPHFREDRTDVLHAAMRATGLPILITQGPDGMTASHVPLLLEASTGPFGTLLGHLARANPQIRSKGDALAIFQGLESYITPSWYATKRETGKVVPTWNYVAVHAMGPITFFDDATRLLDIVTRLTDREETKRAAPWAVSDAPSDFVSGMLKGIVGFSIPIARLEGKWKMSQNRPAADRAGVKAGLAEENRKDVAALIPPA